MYQGRNLPEEVLFGGTTEIPWRKAMGKWQEVSSEADMVKEIKSWKPLGFVTELRYGGMVYKAVCRDGSDVFVESRRLLTIPGCQESIKEDFINRTKQEVMHWSQLEHKNVVKYYGIDKGRWDISIFFEPIFQQSIAAVYENKYMEETIVARYTKEVLITLVFLHSNDVLHRNIRPESIFIDDDGGSVKLGYFGFLKSFKDFFIVSPTKTWLKEIAPEVKKDGEFTEKTDIWCLGTTIIQMLMTHRGYVLHLSKQIRLANYISYVALDFVNSCMRQEPNERPSAADLLNHPFLNQAS